MPFSKQQLLCTKTIILHENGKQLEKKSLHVSKCMHARQSEHGTCTSVCMHVACPCIYAACNGGNLRTLTGVATTRSPLPSPAPVPAAACWVGPVDDGPASCWGCPAAADDVAPSSWPGRSHSHVVSSAAPSSCPLGSDSVRPGPPGNTNRELS